MIIYINNKYHKIYHNLIQKSRNRILCKPFEEHHIVPKALGGTDDISNIVKLTSREHYFAHKLLVRITIGQQKYKMIAALNFMTTNNRHNVTSRDYEYLRKHVPETMSFQMKEFWKTERGLNLKIEYANKMKNKKRDPSIGKKISEVKKGTIFSKEHLKNLSESHLGQIPINRKKVCDPNGIIYSHAAAAAKDHDIHPATIQYRCRKNIMGWKYITYQT